MVIEHPPKLGPDTQVLGVEPVVWMHVAYGGTAGEGLTLYPISSKTGPALYEPMIGPALRD